MTERKQKESNLKELTFGAMTLGGFFLMANPSAEYIFNGKYENPWMLYVGVPLFMIGEYALNKLGKTR